MNQLIMLFAKSPRIRTGSGMTLFFKTFLSPTPLRSWREAATLSARTIYGAIRSQDQPQGHQPPAESTLHPHAHPDPLQSAFGPVEAVHSELDGGSISKLSNALLLSLVQRPNLLVD